MHTQTFRASRALRRWFRRSRRSRRSGDPASGPRHSIDVAPLEDRTLYSATPIVLDAVDVQAAEDGPDTRLPLPDFFSLDDAGGPVEYSIIENPHSGLFSHWAIDDQDNLLLALAPDQHGAATLQIQALDAQGQVEQLPVQVWVQSVNDAPISHGLDDVNVRVGTDRTVIHLFDAFDDVEDADEDLTFHVLGDTDSDLFSSIRLNQERGLLILDYAEGAKGSADLTIVATDTGGLSVGLGARAGFAVYDQIAGEIGVQSPDTEAIGLSPLSLWTSWFFFDRVDGQYQFDHIDEEHFRALLHDPRFADPDVPITFDIENEYFGNTPEGRDRFAEVAYIANQERPDLEIGFYSFLPERSWYHPVNWDVLQQHQELGVSSWYTQNGETFTQRHELWQANNELYRTEPVSPQYGGVPLADLVDTVNPSLYTFYRNVNAEPIWHAAALDGQSNTVTVEGLSLDQVQQVRITKATDARLPSGLSPYVEYYLVNGDGATFQLSETPDGPPVDFGDDVSGRIYVGDIGPWEHPLDDPTVLRWRNYAESMIAEAREYDKPVYAWISPSLRGIGAEHLEEDFFRMQLEILKPLVDGIVIYEPPTRTADYHESQGWWHALVDFMDRLDDPAATFRVRVEPAQVENYAPLAHDDHFSTLENLPLTIDPDDLLANDHDPDQDPLNIRILQLPRHGTLEVTEAGQYRYTPDTDYSGTDQFTYRVNDGHLGSDPATVTLQVVADDNRPVAARLDYQTAEDTRLVLHRSDLLPDDFDASSDTWQIHLVDDAAHGAVRVAASGAIIYSPERNYHGLDRFGYRVTNEEGQSQLVKIQVEVTPENDTPKARLDRYQVTAGSRLNVGRGGVLQNDGDLDGDPLGAQLLRGPEHGSLVLRPNGSFVYTPDRFFAGRDHFRYVAFDDQGGRSVGTVTIRVDGWGGLEPLAGSAKPGLSGLWDTLLRRWHGVDREDR